MYIISGRGRKSGVARATGATASLAPMSIYLFSKMGDKGEGQDAIPRFFIAIFLKFQSTMHYTK